MAKEFTTEEKKERIELLMRMKLSRITITMVAEELGCSKSWVSQYINGKIDMTESMKEKMIKYIEEIEGE